MVSSADNASLVVWHLQLVGGNNVEPCHHPGTIDGGPMRWRPAAAAQSARCPGQDRPAQDAMA